MIEKIQRKIWLTENRGYEPLPVTENSKLPIELEVMDVTLSGETALVYAWNAKDGEYVQNGIDGSVTVSGQIVTIVPSAGLFLAGRGKLQVHFPTASGNIITRTVPIDCQPDFSTGGETPKAEAVKPLIERAEQANAEAKAIQNDLRQNYPLVPNLANDVNSLKKDLEQVSSGYEIFEIIENEYVTTGGSINPYIGWGRTDYIEIDSSYPIIINATHRSVYNQYFDADKVAVGPFIIVVGQQELNPPKNAHYIMLSDSLNYIKQVSVRKQNAEIKTYVEDYVEDAVKKNSSRIFEDAKYPEKTILHNSGLRKYGVASITDEFPCVISVSQANVSAGATTAQISADTSLQMKLVVKGVAQLNNESSYKIRIYLYGVKDDGNIVLTSKELGVAVGEFEYIEYVDTASYKQYNDVDKYYLLIYTNCTGTITVNELFIGQSAFYDSPIYGENLKEIVNATSKKISEVDNSLSLIESKKLDAVFESPSGRKFFIYVDDNGNIKTKSNTPTKALFVGNSLLFGNETFGLCASDSEHDYYNHVTAFLAQGNGNFSSSKVYGSTWEHYTTSAERKEWVDTTLSNALSVDTDFVCIQLGDNVNTAEKRATFIADAKYMIDKIKSICTSARIAWVAQWYYGASNTDIQNICNEKGVVFVPIRDLRVDGSESYVGALIDMGTSSERYYQPKSYTETDDAITMTFDINGTDVVSDPLPYTNKRESGGYLYVTSRYKIVSSKGSASHPGDSGMQSIAKRIMYTLGWIKSDA